MKQGKGFARMGGERFAKGFAKGFAILMPLAINLATKIDELNSGFFMSGKKNAWFSRMQIRHMNKIVCHVCNSLHI